MQAFCNTCRDFYLEKTGVNRLTHPFWTYINSTCYALTAAVCVLCLCYSEWIIDMKNWKIYFTKFTMSLVFKNYLLAEVAYLLIRFNKTKLFLWNTKSTDRNGVYKLRTRANKALKEMEWSPNMYRAVVITNQDK